MISDWIRVAPSPLSLVCIRHREGDDRTKAALDAINASGEAMLSHTKLHDGQDLMSDVLVADLRLINTAGDVIAEALNFRVKKAGRELLMQSVQEDTSDWYYQLQWAPVPDAAAAGALAPRAVRA